MEIYTTVNRTNANLEGSERDRDQFHYINHQADPMSSFPHVNENAKITATSTSTSSVQYVKLNLDSNGKSINSKTLPVTLIENQIMEPIEIYEKYELNNNGSRLNDSQHQPSENYSVRVQTDASSSSQWHNLDTYLHIFLTFFFGHFASMLFFDGILRNISYLFVFNAPGLYIISILFSIIYLSFSLWLLTICWKWWRHKSLLPYDSRYVPNVPALQKQQNTIAHAYIFIAALVLAIGLLIYITLGVVDIRIKNYHNYTVHVIETIIFILRIILWIIGIIALLLLNRNYFISRFCPSLIKPKQKTIVYEIRQ